MPEKTKKADRAPTWSTVHAVVKLRPVDRRYAIWKHAQRLANPELDALPTAKDQVEADLQAAAGEWAEKLQKDADEWEEAQAADALAAKRKREQEKADARVEAARLALEEAEAKRQALEGGS